MERQRDRNGDRRDDEDRYRRRRDDDRYRSECDGQDRRISNRSDEEDKDGSRDRYRNMDRDRGSDDRRREMSRDASRRRRGRGRSRSVSSDEEDDKDMTRCRRRDVRVDEEDGSDRRKKETKEDSKRRGRSKAISSDDEDGEIKKIGNKSEEKSDEEDGEFRNTDDSDDDGRRRDRKRDRRSNGDHKDRRRNNDVSKRRDYQNGDKENVDEGPRFQKLAEMQEGMTNLGKSGGLYIPPFKLARMMSEVQGKSSMEYQRMTWDALKKSINGLVNEVNATNIKNIIPELFAENLIRGRVLFCRSCMKSQMASPGFTEVFAALVAVVNTKFPEVGNLLLRRIILQLQRAYKRNDKCVFAASITCRC